MRLSILAHDRVYHRHHAHVAVFAALHRLGAAYVLA